MASVSAGRVEARASNEEDVTNSLGSTTEARNEASSMDETPED